MPNPGSAAPALSLAALGETVDLLGVVVAQMSDKLDQHGHTLAGMQKIAVEGRDAAQAAKVFSDPKRYADHIGQEVYDALGESLDRLQALHVGFATDRQDANLTLSELVRQEEAVRTQNHGARRLLDGGTGFFRGALARRAGARPPRAQREHRGCRAQDRIGRYGMGLRCPPRLARGHALLGA